MDKLEEIFKLQEELNDKVFFKHGIRVPIGSYDPSTGDAHLRTKDIRDELDDGKLGPNRLPNIWLRNYLRALQEEADELGQELLWKWWSRDEIDMQNVRVEIVDIMHFLVSLALASGLSAEDFHRLYTKKHRVNEQRQDDGYSKTNKNDSDNMTVI